MESNYNLKDKTDQNKNLNTQKEVIRNISKFKVKKEKVHNKLSFDSNKELSDQNNDTKTSRPTLYEQVTTDDLQKLCDQLSAFNARIQTAKNVIYLRYDLPFELRDKLEVEASELECLHAELQSAANLVDTIHSQREALAQEKLVMETQLAKLTDEASHELEVIVSVYDSSMMERWEDVKASESLSTVENFIHDVKGRLEAMKNLQVLGTQRLADLQQNKRKDLKKSNYEKEKLNRNEKENGSSQNRSIRSGSNIANASNSSLSFLLECDSEDMMTDSSAHSVLYSLVCEQVLNLPPWTQGPEDVDID